MIAANRADIKPGNAMPMENMPVGTIIHNVEMKPGRGGQMARAAGTYVQLIGKDSGYAQLRLTSGELRMVPANAWQPLAQFRMPTTRTRTCPRPVAVVGSANARRFVASR